MTTEETEAPLTYTGPERRLSCVCHPKHQRILEDHDAKLRQHEENLHAVVNNIIERRDELDRRTDGKITEIWQAIRTKLNTKIFLALILAFSGSFIGTMFYVVNDINSIRLEIMRGMGELHIEMQKVKTEVQVQGDRIGNLQYGFHNLDDKIGIKRKRGK